MDNVKVLGSCLFIVFAVYAYCILLNGHTISKNTLAPQCPDVPECINRTVQCPSPPKPKPCPAPGQRKPCPSLTDVPPRLLSAVYGTSMLSGPVPEVAGTLDPDLAPNIVFTVWCKNTEFNFAEFLSLLSVLKMLQPDVLFFYCVSEPKVKVEKFYNTWFQELQDEYPHLIVKTTSGKNCEFDTPSQHFVQSIMDESGGVYIKTGAMLNKFPLSLMKPKNTSAVGDLGDLYVQKMEDRGYISCLSQNCVDQAEFRQKDICVHLEDKLTPEEIWHSTEPYAYVARRIFYNSPEIVRAKRSKGSLTPNIAHMVWIGNKPMPFKFYLSVLSLIHTGKMDAVYIHTAGELNGPYWNKVKHHPKVKVIYRHPASNVVYGQSLKVRVEHWSDIIRLDVLIKYGGLYVDTDAMMIKPLTEDLRSYDVVISKEFEKREPFPDSLGNSAMLGKKNAEFFRLFLTSFRWLYEKSYLHNGIYAPYKLAERHPHLIHIEPRLEVQCAFEDIGCHPTWHKDFRSLNVSHLNTDSLKNWKNDTFIYHLNIKVMQSEEYCKKPKDMVGTICRYILEQAGVF